MIQRLLISISALLLVGCGSNPVKGLTARPIEPTEIVNPYFSDASRDYLYRTTITVYGHEFSGLLIAKKIDESLHRVVLTTDFGNTLLDLEIGDEEFEVNSVVDELNRKILLNTLRDDFRLLFKRRFTVSKTYGQQQPILESSGPQTDWLYVSEGRLRKIVHGSPRKQRVSIAFQSENDTFAQNIKILHTDLRLLIEMNALNQ